MSTTHAAEITPACVTTSHWATHVSAECGPGGSGQCDGLCANHPNTECTCECHRDWFGDMPTTVAGMEKWHVEHHGGTAADYTPQHAR